MHSPNLPSTDTPHTHTHSGAIVHILHILPVYQMSFVLVCLMPWVAKFMTTDEGEGEDQEGKTASRIYPESFLV